MYRHIGFVHGHDVWKWKGFYYVNPVPNVGGVLLEDPKFKTLREVFGAKELLEKVASERYNYPL